MCYDHTGFLYLSVFNITSPRPLDRLSCPNNNCVTCKCLTKGECTIRNVVYRIDCDLCGEFYIDETYRPLHARFQEHCSPLKASYKDKPLAKHYSDHHPNNTPPQLSVIIRDSNIKDRKVKEARMIITQKPSINNKDELKDTKLFLIQCKDK